MVRRSTAGVSLSIPFEETWVDPLAAEMALTDILEMLATAKKDRRGGTVQLYTWMFTQPNGRPVTLELTARRVDHRSAIPTRDEPGGPGL